MSTENLTGIKRRPIINGMSNSADRGQEIAVVHDRLSEDAKTRLTRADVARIVGIDPIDDRTCTALVPLLENLGVPKETVLINGKPYIPANIGASLSTQKEDLRRQGKEPIRSGR